MDGQQLEIPTNSIDKEFDVISTLPPEQQKSIFKIFKETNIQNSMKIKELENEIKKRDKAIEIFATAGIDIRDLHSLQEISEKLNMKPEEAIYLLDNNEEEFIKMFFRHYKVLVAEKKRLLSDMQVDIDGIKINNRLKKVRDGLISCKDLDKLTPNQVRDFPSIVDEFEKTHDLLIGWQTVHADLETFNEAITHAIIHYAVKHVKQKVMSAQNIVYNPEEEMRKQKAKQDEEARKKVEDEKKKIEEEKKKQEEDKNKETKQQELEKKIDAMKQTNEGILDKLNKLISGSKSEEEEIEEGEEEEQKGSKKRRG